jgi:hypothetical protein
MPVKEIMSFAFKNPKISTEIKRALALLAAARGAETRELEVSLRGTGAECFIELRNPHADLEGQLPA